MTSLNKLKDFLDLHKGVQNSGSNITSLEGKWGGSWYIEPKRYIEFIELYTNAVKCNNLKLVEKKRNSDELFRMFADVDISKEDIDQHYPNGLPDAFLQTIVDTYEKVILEFFEVSKEFAKPIISCRLKQTSKMHLNWPFIIVNNVLGRVIRNAVKDILVKYNDGNWDKWLDSASYTCTGLRMLGSVKPRESYDNRYYIIENFTETNNTNGVHYELSLDDIRNTSIRNIDSELTKLSPKGEISLGEVPKSKIQIVPKAAKTAVLNDALTPMEKNTVERGFLSSWENSKYDNLERSAFSINNIKKYGNLYIMPNKEKINCMFKGAPHKRDNPCHYHALCEQGTYIGCYDELCKGKRFPDPPIPLPEEIHNYLYVININGGNNNIINVNTGPICSKTDNPISEFDSSVQLDFINDIDIIKVYNDVSKDTIVLKALNGGDQSLAHLLYQCAGDKFYYTKKTGWWYWNGKIWVKDEGHELMYLLSEELINVSNIAKKLYKIQKEIHLKNKKPSKNDFDSKINQIDKVCKRLENREYKLKIIGDAEWVFAKKNIFGDLYAQLDQNPYLLAFTNGVYDLSKDEFRPTRCEDFISITCGYEYTDQLVAQDQSDLVNFINSVMPDIDDRHYMLKLLASGLLGLNPNELFHIFTGAGRNGKSKLNDLIQMTFGEYFASFTSSFLTSKTTGSEQAAPQLMSLQKK